MQKRLISFNNFQTEVKLRGESYLRVMKRVVDSGWYILGSEVEDFEEKFANYIGIKHCIGVGNGLEALQISLMALGIGPGDEVITTPFSAVATTLSILAVGAKPVFIDVDTNGQLNPNLIELAITKRTKAVLPVHLFGAPAQINRIRAICKMENLYLVEDACQAHGSSFRGKKLGSFGEMGCFSFYPTKNLGAMGDGGVIVTNDEELAQLCRQIRDYGQERKYFHVRYGLNSRLDEVQAAVLNAKLEYLDKDNKRRRNLAKRYFKNLKGVGDIQLLGSQELNSSNFHLVVVRTGMRDRLRVFLGDRGVQTLVHYPVSIPDQPFLRDKYAKVNVPESRRMAKEVLSLPCNPWLEMEDIDFVCESIREFFQDID